MRLQKTHASHAFQDDVPGEVKQRRLEELISAFREEAVKVNSALVGTTQLVLVEGVSTAAAAHLTITTRTDGHKVGRVSMDATPLCHDVRRWIEPQPHGTVMSIYL